MDLRIDRRRLNAERITAQVMQIVDPYMSDFDGQKYQARNELFAVFYDADVEITTKVERDLAAAMKRLED